MKLLKSTELTFKNRIYEFCQKYKHGSLMLYWLIYIPWFSYLEKSITNRFHIIHMSIDDKIPFIEYFIIPYFLWFAYIAAALLYFSIKDKAGYYKLCIFLFTGMTLFLVVSTVYPNGHHLRPVVFERDNIFVDMVRALYRADTPTNLFPSIHVYNSIGVNIAVWNSVDLKNNRLIRYGSATLMSGIILSTMFLKQHSVFDVITGIVCALFLYTLVYSRNALRVGKSETALEEWVRHI